MTETANPRQDSEEFTATERQVLRYRPDDVKAPNHNDLRAFIHSWFAAFDHTAPAEFFLAHLDAADMTFNFDGEPLATDHDSFRVWYADALRHIPWDFHDVMDGVTITGVYPTGWMAEFYFRHVGDWHDTPIGNSSGGEGRHFNRVLRANWRVEHDGESFVIRRYELANVQDVLPL